MPIGDTGGQNDFSFHPKKYLQNESMTSLPNIEIRVSKVTTGAVAFDSISFMDYDSEL